MSVNKNYTFIAYSFGCAIAIEVLKVLECQRKVGRLFLIDVDLIASCSIMTKLEVTGQIMNETIFQFLPVFWPKFPKLVSINFQIKSINFLEKEEENRYITLNISLKNIEIFSTVVGRYQEFTRLEFESKISRVANTNRFEIYQATTGLCLKPRLPKNKSDRRMGIYY